jgi:hypothetical protein
MEVIEFYHVLFIGKNVGTSVLSQADINILKKFGINPTSLIGLKFEQAFRFGVLSSALKNSTRLKNLSYDDFKRFLKSGGALPLTAQEKYALQSLKQQAYGDIKGLGNRVQQQFNQMIITVSQKQRGKMQKLIESAAKETLMNRGSVGQLSSLLGHKTKDWARDFDRIADYIMHSAYQHGISTKLLEDYGDDVEVYYDVYEGACEHCIRTYLTNGLGSEPKVFKLKDILRNGNNIGRKAKNYLPSVDPLHPWCRCTINRKPPDSVWDMVKQAFVLVRNTYGVKRKSKIKITIS